jgi:DNA invertase Pin-like site-specific DNA recombinase
MQEPSNMATHNPDARSAFAQPLKVRTAKRLGRKLAHGDQQPGRVYTYTRVSTARQSDLGESLDVQQRQISGYATMIGVTIDHAFIERGVSGAKPLGDRPAGCALLNQLQPGDTIITTKIDRMFRSALDALNMLARFKERGISLHITTLGGDTTGNGISKLMFLILSGVAEMEREQISERVSDMKADQRSRGRYLGGIMPFGFKAVPDGEKGKRLEPIPEQQKAIKRMVALRKQGLSLRAIQAKLIEAGFGHVNHDTIATALRNAEARSNPC